MPITPSSNHQVGSYPDTIRHISNGDPANQTFLRNPMLDLEFRTDVLKDELNSFETATAANFNDTVNFDDNHDHSGSRGEKVLDFGQIYSNGPIIADFNLTALGKFIVRQQGTNTAPVLLELDEAGTTPATKIIFPGSVGMFAHVDAAASDLTTNPHNLKLAARLFPISAGCKVGVSADSVIVLNTTALINTDYSALGLAGQTPSDGVANEGVIVGAANNSNLTPANIVLVHDQSTNDLKTSGGNPIYGLLTNLGTQLLPSWQLSFFTTAGVYTFPASTPVFLKLYAMFAYSLSTAPVVDPRLILLARSGIKAV
jgi:hypothetical protein